MHGQAAIIHRLTANYAFTSIPVSAGGLTKVQVTPYSKALYNLADPYPESDLYPASERCTFFSRNFLSPSFLFHSNYDLLTIRQCTTLHLPKALGESVFWVS